MNKKLTGIFLAASFAALSITATSFASDKTTAMTETESEIMTGMANPNLYDQTAEDVEGYIGIKLTVPKDAEDVKYAVIGYQDEHPIAEMNFKLDQKEYYLRAQVTDKTSLSESDEAMTDMEASLNDLLAVIDNLADDTSVNLSGIFNEWDSSGNTMISDYEGAYFGGKEGAFVAWLDTDAGIMYNLCSTDNLKTPELQEIAMELYSSVTNTQ